MNALADISPRREMRPPSDLEIYLLGSNGCDILEFDDITTARLAADTLRARAPGVLVEACYTRVHLRIAGGAPCS